MDRERMGNLEAIKSLKQTRKLYSNLPLPHSCWRLATVNILSQKISLAPPVTLMYGILTSVGNFDSHLCHFIQQVRAY